MEQHTPGPWHWGNKKYGDNWLYAGDGETSIIEYAGCGSHDCEVNEDNARLIAAAPDMVNALEAVQQRITEAMDLERISPAQALEELAIIVSATLAKALGE